MKKFCNAFSVFNQTSYIKSAKLSKWHLVSWRRGVKMKTKIWGGAAVSKRDEVTWLLSSTPHLSLMQAARGQISDGRQSITQLKCALENTTAVILNTGSANTQPQLSNAEIIHCHFTQLLTCNYCECTWPWNRPKHFRVQELSIYYALFTAQLK